MSAQRITFWLGVFYVLIGILGFVPGITSNGLLLGIFAVNAIHNLAHLLVGVGLVWGAMSGNAISVNKVMTVVFALLVVASFVAPIVEQLPLNLPDTVLHLVSMLITGYLGFAAPRTTTALR